MSKDETYISKVPDILGTIQNGRRESVQELLENPPAAFAAALTGFFASGPKDWILGGGHIVQAYFRANALQQFGIELKALIDRGQIPNDFTDKPKGYQTWVELLMAIDQDTPDEEKLDAMKAMFFAVNKVNAADGERIVAYRLFQMAKKLTSSELLLLRTVHHMNKERKFGTQGGFRDWALIVAAEMGHKLLGLIEQDEKALVENGLLSVRQLPDGSGINPLDGRLTDVGLEFCRNIETYHIEVSGAK